jgi:uncharacterized spore protein YtfJ
MVEARVRAPDPTPDGPVGGKLEEETMFLEELQKRFADMQDKAGVKAVFGDPVELDGRKIIPVASVQYGFGMGGGTGPKKEEGEAPSGGAGGAGARIEPIAVVEVVDGKTKVMPIVNVTRMAVIGAFVAAWGIFWITRTIRRVVPECAQAFAAARRDKPAPS